MLIRAKVVGLDSFRDNLIGKARQIEIATQRAIINTAKAVIKEEQDEMGRVFKMPTRFTLNALTTTFDKKNMSAHVKVKDGYWSRADNYLNTQMVGGQRKNKAFERALQSSGILPTGWLAVPGKAASCDAFGNMAVGQIRQILSWFDAAERWSGSTQNMGQKGRDKRRKGTKTKRGFEYFAVYPGFRLGRGSWRDGRFNNLTPGIYKRTAFGFGKAIQPVMIFVKTAAYAPRFKFYEVANHVVDSVYQTEFVSAIARELSK